MATRAALLASADFALTAGRDRFAPVSPMLQAMATALAYDQRSFDAGYQAGLAGSRCGCPAGFNLYSFYLGREAACPGGSHKKCNQGE